jgi:Na+-transporting methylmalonyl-CoA/oxaloacetate decarboxylase gamma subunit
MFISNTEQTSGASVVIGVLFALVFAVLIASVVQTQVVPIEEEETEYVHSNTVQQQLASMENQIQATAVNNVVSSQPLSLGTSFQSRVVFGIFPIINSPDPTGTISYSEFGADAQFSGFEGQGGAEEFWDGSDKAYNTGVISYDPEYRHYEDAPTTYYEHGITYNEYQLDGNTQYSFLSDQNVISDNNITLITLDGDMDISSSQEVTLSSSPVSAPSNTVAVEATNAEIRLPTNLPEDIWRNELLDDEPRVDSVNKPNDDVVVIGLQDGVYTMTLSRAFISNQTSEASVPNEPEAYIGWDQDQVILREESRTQIDAQVRDRFDNPVTGIPVYSYARDNSGSCVGGFQSGPAAGGPQSCSAAVAQPGLKTSTQSGEVTFVYESPRVDSDTSINVSLQFEDT